MDTSDVAANEGKDQQPVLNVGLTLREAREHLGMSVHDVAERIKFAPRQVEALEANDFAHLPEPAFLRGFVRSYARVLQLDEVALIAALPSGQAKEIAAKSPGVEVAFPTLFSLQRINLLWLAGALVVALLLGLFVLLHDGEVTPKPTEVTVEPVPLPSPDVAASAVAETEAKLELAEPAKVAEPNTVSEPGKTQELKKALEPSKVIEPTKKAPESIKAPEPKKMPEPVKAPELKKTPEPTKASEPKKLPEPAKAIQPVVKAAPQPAVASADEAKSSAALEALKRRPMHFVFTGDSWAEVIDAHGTVLLSRNNEGGTEKWVGGPRHAPYDITIARPGNVKLYYKGKEIDLSSYSAMKVAHLKVE